MKQILSIMFSLVLIFSFASCSSIGQALKPDAPVTEDEATETTDSGFMISVKKKNSGQNDMLEALTLLEKIYGQPVVVTNANVIGVEKATVRYTLYFDVNDQLYTVATITNGQILSIDTINKSAVVLESNKVPVLKLVPAEKTRDEIATTN